MNEKLFSFFFNICSLSFLKARLERHVGGRQCLSLFYFLIVATIIFPTRSWTEALIHDTLPQRLRARWIKPIEQWNSSFSRKVLIQLLFNWKTKCERKMKLKYYWSIYNWRPNSSYYSQVDKLRNSEKVFLAQIFFLMWLFSFRKIVVLCFL